MAINPSSLIYEVRRELADIPEDHAADEVINQQLDHGWEYIQVIIDVSSEDEDYVSHCLIILSAYFTYLEYTSLAERNLGELPAGSKTKIDALRHKAWIFLEKISIVKLNPDLTYDDKAMSGIPNVINIIETIQTP